MRKVHWLSCALLVCLSLAAQAQSVVDVKQPVEATAPTPTAPKAEKTATLPRDTNIHLQLAERISSHTAKVGEPVHFRTVGDTSVNGVVLVPDNTDAEGIVTAAKRKGHLGRAGALVVNIEFLRLRHGVKVRLVGTESQKGQGHGKRTAVATGLAAGIFWPVSPFFLLLHGQDVVLNAGTPLTVFVDVDTVVPLLPAE